MPAFLSLSSLHLSSLLLLHLSFLLSLAHLPHSPFPSSFLISLHALLGPSFCPITNYTINLCSLTLFYFCSFVLFFSALATPQLSVSFAPSWTIHHITKFEHFIHSWIEFYLLPCFAHCPIHLSSYLSPSFIKKNFSSLHHFPLLSFTMTSFAVLIPPCGWATAVLLLTAHSSILSFTSPAKSLSNRCRTHSVGPPSVWVCVWTSVCCVGVIKHVCVREHVWACVHAYVSVEQAWPRLIAASYLVVTGLIKDDELTVGLSLCLSLSLTLFLFRFFWQ